MFNFIESQINILKDNDTGLEDRVTAYKKANIKLKKIKDIFASTDGVHEDIDETNIDASVSHISQFLRDFDIDNIKLGELKELISIKSSIENCKKLVTNGQITKVFVHEKNGETNEITTKMKEGLFIEQIKDESKLL